MSAVEGWRKTSLGQVAVLVKGVSYASEDYTGPDEGAVFITIKCVSKSGGFKPAGIKYFKGRIEKSQELQEGDLLIANTDLTRAGDIIGAPIVVPSLDSETLTMSMDLSKLVEDDTQIDREFLYYKLMTDSVRRFMKNHASGSTVLHLQTRAVPSLELSFPGSKPEQTKIAEVLSTVDRAIEQTEALIAKQQRIKTGLMQDLLTRGIDEHGNLRSEETHEFKDSPLGRIPVEWEVAPISEHGSRNRPFLRTGPFGSDLNTRHWIDHGVPVVTIGSLGEGMVIETELLFVAEPTARALESFCVAPGDIIFSRVADIGRSLVVQEHQNDWIISSNLMRISLDNAKARPDFLYKNIAYNSAIRAQLRTTSNSGGRDLVNGSILNSLVFPWPEVDEQDRINEKINSIDAESRYSRQYLQKLRSLKTALMQDLLTGEKRVTPLLGAEQVAGSTS